MPKLNQLMPGNDLSLEADRAAIYSAWRDLKDQDATAGPALVLRLASSRAYWTFLLAKQAHAIGDEGLTEKMRQAIAKEHPASLANLWLAHFGKEAAGAKQALQFLHDQWPTAHDDLVGPWGWAWQIEFHLEMRRLHSHKGQPSAAREQASLALALAEEHKWPGYICSSSYDLFWRAWGDGEYFLADRFLDQFHAAAKELNSRYYLSFYFESKSYVEFTHGGFLGALKLVQRAMQGFKNQAHSRGMDQFRHKKLLYQAMLGEVREFQRGYQHARETFLVAARGPNEPETQHLAIEALELCLTTLDLAQAREHLRRAKLMEHVCCHARVLRQALRLEILAGSCPAGFFSPEQLGAITDDHSNEYERNHAELLRVQYEFKLGLFGKEQQAVCDRLHARLENCPFRYLLFLSRKFAWQRKLSSGVTPESLAEANALLRLTADLRIRGEQAEISVAYEAMAKKLGLTKKSVHLSPVMSAAIIRKDFDPSFSNRVLNCWPYTLLAGREIAWQLTWNKQTTSLVINGINVVALRTHSSAAQFAELLARKKGLVRYGLLAEKLWGEEYRAEYHDQKIHTVVNAFRRAVKEAGFSTGFLQNVPARGYLVSNQRQAPTLAPSSEQKWRALLEEMPEEAVLTAAKLATKFGYGVRQAQRDLSKWVRAGELVARGGKKNRHYIRPRKAS